MCKINIAIDGPAGAGKSTVAKRLADHLQYRYIDTGAMYRVLTWAAVKQDVDVHSGSDLLALAKQLRIVFEPSEHGQLVFESGVDVTKQIRSSEVNRVVSIVAAHEKIRQHMAALQKKLAEEKGVVMDGRDIGTNVLPNAEVKIFLIASVEERAHRRFLDEASPTTASLEEVKNEIEQRDQMDRTRKSSPLKKAVDAVEIDSSGVSVEGVVQQILHIVHRVTQSNNHA